MSSSIGRLFCVTTFGESHGPAVGVVVDGLPGNLPLDTAIIQQWLDRRKPGQSPLTSPRAEADRVEVLSGVEHGRTLGGPVTLIVRNQNTNPADYQDINAVFRPGHGDLTMMQKYGITASSGGGRASARETIGRVAAGAVAWQLLRRLYPDFEVTAWVHSVYSIVAKEPDLAKISQGNVDASLTRCPDPEASTAMESLIKSLKEIGDSAGGTIRCVIKGLPAGLGEPVFDKLEADLAKAMLSLPATKGFEIGSGFAGTILKGSEHNDPLIKTSKGIGSLTNNAGGVMAGISNGETVHFKVAFKPVSTIFLPQETVDRQGTPITFAPAGGRHDPCVLPRAVPMVEAMATIVIADHALRQRAMMPFIDP
jgi:chorismate synthase